MERISNENIELEIEGRFTSAVVDKAGDRIAEGSILAMENQIENNPDKQKFTVDHSGEVVGEILDVWTTKDEEGVLALNGRVGIYEGNDEVIDRIEADELSAFSIEAHYFENTDREEWSNSDQKLTLEVIGEQRGEIHTAFSNAGLKFKTDIEKSATGIAVFTVIVENIHNIALAFVILHHYYSSNGNDGPENIELPNGESIDISQSLEGMLNDIEDSLGEQLDMDYRSQSTEEIIQELRKRFFE